MKIVFKTKIFSNIILLLVGFFIIFGFSFCEISNFNVSDFLIKISLVKDPTIKKELLVQIINDYNKSVMKSGYFIDILNYPIFLEKFFSISSVRIIFLKDFEKTFPNLKLDDIPVVIKPLNMYDLMVLIALLGWLCFFLLLIWHLVSNKKNLK